MCLALPQPSSLKLPISFPQLFLTPGSCWLLGTRCHVIIYYMFHLFAFCVVCLCNMNVSSGRAGFLVCVGGTEPQPHLSGVPASPASAKDSTWLRGVWVGDGHKAG